MTSLITLVVFIALGVWAYKRFKRVRRGGSMKGDPWLRQETDAARLWLDQLGPTHDERMAAIDRMFEAGTATVESTSFFTWNRGQSHGMQALILERQGLAGLLRGPVRQVGLIATVSRSLAGMDNRERTYLRVAEELNSAANGSERMFRTWRTSLIWGDGKGLTTNYQWKGGLAPDDELTRASHAGNSSVDQALKDHERQVAGVLTDMQQFATSAGSRPELNPAYRPIVSELIAKIAPGGGSGAWLKGPDGPGSPFAKRSDYALHIGTLSDGTPLDYSGEGSLVTIAPPGSGKTQCNVFPNLLTWTGPAIVLDISGDIYEHTAGWRAANVGPVYKFSPLEPEDSHKYNPLTFVRSEPDYIWEDARLLAEMMIVPSQSSDPFWENEARTVLTAAISYVCHANEPDQRPMHAVLDVLYGGEAWDQMIVGLKMAKDVRVMGQNATALSGMNEKTLSSVLQTARSSLSAWAGERIARATTRSDWSPLELRDGSNPTIYVYIRPNEVDAYLSLLRVFIGQHIRVLTGGAVPPRDAPPILVMLDELPRLRYMAPVDEGLSIGRKYHLRLWMFAQSLGQFQTAYPNADGMLGSCAVRTFINPGGADGLAERISDELGYVDSINDNTRRKLVEAADLTGPDYKNVQIVFASGGKPAKATKEFAYLDPELKQRMDLVAPSHREPATDAVS
jgi:type IV secretion system protein VirD4